MKLTYANAGQTLITVELDADERLGHLAGPVEACVPVDEHNADYAAIQEQGLAIEAFEPPDGEPTHTGKRSRR